MPSHPARFSPDDPGLPAGGCPASHGLPVPLSSTQMLDEPSVLYENLREHGPVVRVHLDGEVPAWLVTGYDACSRVLRDGLLFTRDLGQWGVTRRGQLPTNWPLKPHVVPMANMLFASGMQHIRLRGAFKTSLAKIGSQRLHAIVTRAADNLIDAFADQGQADLVGQYAVPLPVATLTVLFGFPAADAAPLQRAILTLLDGGRDAVAAAEELSEIIAAHVERRRHEPRADIVTGLLEAGLTVEETCETIWLAINAGIGATTAWTANSCVLLARIENARSDLRAGLRHIPGVMAEVLWDHTPVQQVIGRVATAITELAGTTVQQGDLLVLSLGAANCDHERFGGRDGRSRYIEDNASHLAWGGGAHECPAQGLATSIVRGGVERLWTRLDDIHLTRPEQPTQWSPSIIVRIPVRLDVSFDPARARARAATLAPIGER